MCTGPQQHNKISFSATFGIKITSYVVRPKLADFDVLIWGLKVIFHKIFFSPLKVPPFNCLKPPSQKIPTVGTPARIFQRWVGNRRILAQNRQFSNFLKKFSYHPQVPPETHKMCHKNFFVPATICSAWPKIDLALFRGLKMGSGPYLGPGVAGVKIFFAIN